MTSNLEPSPAPGSVPIITDDPEALPGGKIAAVLIASLVLFAVGIIWSVLLSDQRKAELREEQGETALPAMVGQPEIGIVDQQLFETEHRAADLKLEKVARLHSYGWVDKEKKVVHIPIEKAIDQVLAEQQR